jgi:hypothetical protein
VNEMEDRMAGSKDNLKDRLSRYRQIKISVIGRKSGTTISVPVWFVAEGDTLYLLPVHAPTPNGTRTFSRTRRFGLMRGAWKPHLRQNQSQSPVQ